MRQKIHADAKARGRAYAARNRDRRNAYAREYRARKKAENPAAWHEYNRRAKKYPTPTRPAPAVCEACNRPTSRDTLDLDHDHASGEFRGWLCSNCNKALGLLADSEVYIMGLLTYLRRAAI